MKLSQLLPHVEHLRLLSLPEQPEPSAHDPGIAAIQYDTRQIAPGDVYVALRGSRDGHDFFAPALSLGAALLVGDDEAKLLGALGDFHRLQATPARYGLLVQDTRLALAQLSAARAGHPTRAVQMVGVTGTNGKTTTTYLVEGILRRLGHQPGVIGTVEYRLGATHWHSELTTPEAPALQATLAKMRDLGASHVVMEVSSHGLAMRRVGGIVYQAAAFTNLTQDHLDFHQSMDAYFAAKARLFTPEHLAPGGAAVLNLDDPKGRELAAQLDALHQAHPEAARRVIGFSLDPSSGAALRPLEAPRFSLAGIEARLSVLGAEHRLVSPLVGPHNLANLLTALGLALGLGGEAGAAVAALASCQGAPGRLERVPGPQGVDAFVDYAHSPDALERVLEAMRPLTPGRLIAVFGCGGDRDRGKRPKMGEVVGRLADLAVVTSDNPRTEEPSSIVEMILPGVRQGGMQPGAPQKGFYAEVDRRRAIDLAVSLARPGDAILIFGKGHEDYQILGTTKVHFDDREEARRAFAAQLDAAR